MRRVRSKAPRRSAALLVASAAVVLTAACGGNSDSSSSGGQQPGGYGGGNNAFAAYVECLQKNGVTVTMPSGGVRNRPSDGASRGPGAFPSGQPRPDGSAGPGGGGPGGGGFRGGGMMTKPEGVDDATWQKAQTACASLRPSGRPGGNGNGGGMNAAFQNCLKDHGVTTTGGQLNTADATVKKAVEACKVLQPQASATPSA